eukprot:1564536-Amphidinium_carterae.1
MAWQCPKSVQRVIRQLEGMLLAQNGRLGKFGGIPKELEQGAKHFLHNCILGVSQRVLLKTARAQGEDGAIQNKISKHRSRRWRAAQQSGLHRK